MIAWNLWKLGRCSSQSERDSAPENSSKNKMDPWRLVGLEGNSQSKSIGIHFKCQGCKKNFLKALQLGMAQTFARLLNYTPKTGSQKNLAPAHHLVAFLSFQPKHNKIRFLFRITS